MEDKFAQAHAQVSQTYGSYAKKIDIPSGIPIVMRIVGDRNDFVSYLESWIMCDDGVKRPFIIRNEQGKSPLYDMIGDKDNFYKGGFLESIKDTKTNKPKYIWQMKDPELFNIIMYNDNLSGADGSWKARVNYAFNAILRNNTAEEGRMFNWCVENKHTMLLVINPTGFKSLGDLIQMSGKISEYDIAYIKTGTGFETKHNVVKATPDDVNVNKNPEFNIAIIGELTQEELCYAKYSLEKETALKPASVILEKLGNTIQRVSSVMGQDWLSKFEKEASYEVASDTAGASMPHTSYAAVANSDTEKEPDWVAATVKEVTTDTVAASAIASEATATAEPITARIIRTPIEASTVLDAVEVCFMCKEEIPAGSETCPKCKNVLLEPCVDCGKPFHVSLTVCPHCGKKYKTAQ